MKIFDLFSAGAYAPEHPVRIWVDGLPADTTPEQAWNSCPFGTVMIATAARVGVDRKIIVSTVADAVEPSVSPHAVDAAERAAIDTARRWVRGEATEIECLAASDAAHFGRHDAAARVAALCFTGSLAHVAREALHLLADGAAWETGAGMTPESGLAHEVSLLYQANLVRARIPWPTIASASGYAQPEAL